MWKDIIGFEGYYQINEYGEVRSVDRYVNNNGTKSLKKGIILKPFINTTGYYQVKLSKKGKVTMPLVHRLVAIHFIENEFSLEEVNHIDHDKLNCHVSNLEWVTRKENQEKQAVYYGGRLTKKCLTCNKEFISKKSQNQEYCSNSCINRTKSRKVERPSKDELLRLIKSNSFSKIGIMFGVSDNAIRKWCIAYGIPSTKKDIDKIK